MKRVFQSIQTITQLAQTDSTKYLGVGKQFGLKLQQLYWIISRKDCFSGDRIFWHALFKLTASLIT